jgi:hypothetical protein
MFSRKPSHLIVASIAALASMLATVQCSKDNPAPAPTPTPTLTVSSVTISPASISPGGWAQGTVTLSATMGSTVTLMSSNTAVATVPGSVTVAAGQTSAAFTVTGVAAGTSAITAAASGSQGTASITVAPGAALVLGLTLSASSVVGGNPITGTLVISSPAPAGGMVVTLSSSDPVTVPANVTIPAGQTTATFTVNTRAVGGNFNNVPINASAGSLNTTATLTVTTAAPTVPIAQFTVSGPGGANTCRVNNGGAGLDCTFDGTASTASPGGTLNQWIWTYKVAGLKSQNTTTPTLSPTTDCGLLGSGPLPVGQTSLQMTVTLAVRDTVNATSAVATNNNVSVIPLAGVCGF